MKPEQVKFCYAVAHGYRKVAEVLLPQINLWDKEHSTSLELTFSPALISLALASSTEEERQFCLTSLSQLFPQVKDPCVLNEDGLAPKAEDLGPQENCKEVVRALIYPPLKASLVKFLHDSLKTKVLALNADMITLDNALWIICAFRGLKLILNDPYFALVPPEKMNTVKTVFDALSNYLNKAMESLGSLLPATSLPVKAPNTPVSIQALKEGTDFLDRETLLASPSATFTVAFNEHLKKQQATSSNTCGPDLTTTHPNPLKKLRTLS